MFTIKTIFNYLKFLLSSVNNSLSFSHFTPKFLIEAINHSKFQFFIQLIYNKIQTWFKYSPQQFSPLFPSFILLRPSEICVYLDGGGRTRLSRWSKPRCFSFSFDADEQKETNTPAFSRGCRNPLSLSLFFLLYEVKRTRCQAVPFPRSFVVLFF